MPSLRFRVAATTTDALANRKFAVVPAPGAVLNVWSSCVTATDTWGLSIGDKDVVTNGAVTNIESSTTVVDVDRDHTVINEVIPGGQMFLPVTVTTAMNFLIHLRYL